MKKQHVQPMFDEFVKEEASVRRFSKRRAGGQGDKAEEYRFTADMRTFPGLIVPIETLKALTFDKISAYGRPLALVSVIEQSLIGLRDAIARRDKLIHKFASGEVPGNVLPQYYFGMPLPNGDTNQEFPDLVKAIHSYVDDVAFFSALLSDDLVSHGKKVHSRFTERFKKGAPRVSDADFSGPRGKGMIPPNEQYADWLNAFKEQGDRSL